MRRKQRRIFKPKRHHRIKKYNDRTLKIVLTVAGFVALVFIGFSAAKPISEYIEARAAEKQHTRTWTPTAGETAVPEAHASETQPPPPEDPVVTARRPEKTSDTVKASFRLSVSDMRDMGTLTEALDRAADRGYEGVLIPMKTEGGKYWYKTGSSTVALASPSPVMNNMRADEIVLAAQSRGLVPSAYVSALTDNNRYGDDRLGAYHTKSGQAWLDGDPDNGGKPWICPYDEDAQELLCSIMDELGSAGFRQIVCGDFIFPSFRESDVEYIGEEIADGTQRHRYLTALARKMTNAARGAGSDMLICLWAHDILADKAEVFAPDELAGCSLAVRSSGIFSMDKYFSDEFSEMSQSDKLETAYARIREISGGMAIYPMADTMLISRSDMDGVCTVLDTDTYYAEE